MKKTGCVEHPQAARLSSTEGEKKVPQDYAMSAAVNGGSPSGRAPFREGP